MPYTAPTLTEAQTALASRLNDPGFIRWTQAECAVYLREALRTWGAWTAHWREGATFPTVMFEPFYDLPTVLPTLRGQTVSNYDLAREIQYHLIEPPTPSVWTGTDQFTLDQIYTALTRRRDQFLQATGAVLTRTQTPYAGLPASGRIDLDESVLTVRRAAWRPDATQFIRPLIRTDEWGADHYSPAWTAQPGPPGAYSTSITPPLVLQLFPPPSGDGVLDLVSVSRGTLLDASAEVSAGVPNDWSWVVKWGALADLMQGDGLALDPQRAQYCESRWAQGVEMASKASVVLSARVNGIPVRTVPLTDADSYSPTWQLLGNVPKALVLAGQTLVGTWPPPGATGGPWTVDVEVVRNAPVPVLGTDVLQVGADLYDTILDLAQHLALFKEGPGQVELSMALLNRAASAAGVKLGIQQGSQPSRSPLLGQTRVDEYAEPRTLDPVEIT